MFSHRLHWVAATALAGTVLVGAGVWLPHDAAPSSASRNRTQILRDAFDQASSHCYESYQGAELQGCLIGAMQAHLQALGGRDGPAAQIDVVGARRGDI